MRKMLYFWGHTPSHPSGFFLSMEFFIFRLICRLHLGVMTVRERAHITYRKTKKMWPKRCETTISWSPQSLAAEHHFFFVAFCRRYFFPILEETKGTKPNSKHIFSSSAGSMFWMFKHTTYSNCFWCKCTYHSIRSFTWQWRSMSSGCEMREREETMAFGDSDSLGNKIHARHPWHIPAKEYGHKRENRKQMKMCLVCVFAV